MMTMRDFSHLDAVRGSKSRAGQQLSAWEAAYGPVGDDGYPRPLWDRFTGVIDREVAHYMRDNGYDLRHYLERNWSRIGPALVGKLRLYCGEMDNHYLNQGLYLLEDFLSKTQNPHYPGYFEYGRPEADHFWQPMSNSELLQEMAETHPPERRRGLDAQRSRELAFSGDLPRSEPMPGTGITGTVLLLSALLVQSTGDISDDEQAIRRLMERFVAAWNRGDAKAVSELWEVEGVYTLTSGGVVRGAWRARKKVLPKLLTEATKEAAGRSL